MQPIGCRLALPPKRTLRFITVPGILLAGDMAVEDWFVLEFIAAEAPGKRVFRPDNLAGVLMLSLPLVTVADIKRSPEFDDATVGSERIREELPELLRAHVVALDLQLFLRVALIVAVGQISEDKVSRIPRH